MQTKNSINIQRSSAGPMPVAQLQVGTMEVEIGEIAEAELSSTAEKVEAQNVEGTPFIQVASTVSGERSDQPEPIEEASDESNPKAERKYTDTQLHKNRTTLVLAYPPDVRARHLLKFVRELLSLDQEDQAVGLLLTKDYHFQQLIQKREAVLNVALDGDDTSEKLLDIKVKTVELSDRLRALVYSEILTSEQQQQRRQKTLEDQRLAKTMESMKKKR